jgi:hypothetical protein
VEPVLSKVWKGDPSTPYARFGSESSPEVPIGASYNLVEAGVGHSVLHNAARIASLVFANSHLIRSKLALALLQCPAAPMKN